MTTTPQTQVIEEHHSSPAQYVMIGAILVVLTAMEVALYYLEDTLDTGLIVFLLLALAGIKFFLIAAFFMHLKDDPKIFRRWFIIGAIAAILLFTIALVTLHIQDQRFF